MTKDGEIVGLKGTSNGRSCVSHDCCGEHVNLDDLVRFRLSIADIDGKIEEAIQVVRIRDGTESCTIGFLPRNIVKSGKDKFIGKFAQIIELYEDSESEVKRRKSHRNKGVASFRLLEDIPQQE
jgi:hypothetical protein